MKRLRRLDFLGTPRRPIANAGWAAALLGSAMLAFLVWPRQTLDADRQGVAPTPTTPPPARDAVAPRPVPLPAGAASLPWRDVLAVFEVHASVRIGLLRLEPDRAHAGRFKVRAQARDQATLTAFLQALEGDVRLKDIRLVDRAQASSGSDRSLSASVTVLASWRGAPLDPDPSRSPR